MPPNLGKDTSRLRSKEYMRISHPAPVKELNASRDPSGEMWGEREMVPRVVSAC